MHEPTVRRFERLILPHLDEAYTLARYLLRDEHDAQDVVQDAALRAYRFFPGFEERDARAWLLSIVRNCCHSWFERQGREPRAAAGDEILSSVPADGATDERAIRSSEQARIRQAIDALPRDLAEVIVLREISDLSYRDISSTLGIPIGTVMSRLSRARERLATLLGTGNQEAS
jgi:RNA polymerase sigma-70 factor (ECF subfamily)